MKLFLAAAFVGLVASLPFQEYQSGLPRAANATEIINSLESKYFQKRADAPNERCKVVFADDIGDVNSGGYCLRTGTVSDPDLLYTFNGMSFTDCQKEMKRNYFAETSSWNNGVCNLYSSGLFSMGFVPKNVGPIFSQRLCFHMLGQCLPHDSSFEAPQGPGGCSHPWSFTPTDNQPSTLAILSKQQAPDFKPTPSGNKFAKISLHGSDYTKIFQLISLDNQSPQTYTFSYNWIFQSYKSPRGGSVPPIEVAFEASYCGNSLDAFTFLLTDVKPNTAWKTRTFQVSLPPCSSGDDDSTPASMLQLYVSVSGDPAFTDFQTTFGFDNIQLLP